MKKRILLWIVALTVALVGLSAMSATVKGLAVDVDGVALPGASAQLVAVPDSTRAGYVMTGDDGSFRFDGLKPGRYFLQLSMTGMDNVIKDVELKENTDTIDLGKLRLTENSVLLDEAVVTAVRAAVVAKEDTLEFNEGTEKVLQ